MLKKLTCSLIALTFAFSSAPTLLNNSTNNVGIIDVNASNPTEATITSAKLDSLKNSNQLARSSEKVEDIVIPYGYELVSITSASNDVISITDNKTLDFNAAGTTMVTVTAGKITNPTETITATWEIRVVVKPIISSSGSILPDNVIVGLTPSNGMIDDVTINNTLSVLGIDTTQFKSVEVNVSTRAKTATEEEKSEIEFVANKSGYSNIIIQPPTIIYPNVTVATTSDAGTTVLHKASGEIALSLPNPTGVGKLQVVKINSEGEVSNLSSANFINEVQNITSVKAGTTTDIQVNYNEGDGFMVVLQELPRVYTLPKIEVTGETVDANDLYGTSIKFVPATGNTATTAMGLIGADGTLSLVSGQTLYEGVRYDIELVNPVASGMYTKLSSNVWSGTDNGTIAINTYEINHEIVTLTVKDLPAGTWKTNLVHEEVNAWLNSESATIVNEKGDLTFEINAFYPIALGTTYDVYASAIVGYSEVRFNLGTIEVNSSTPAKTFSYASDYVTCELGSGDVHVKLDSISYLPDVLKIKEFSANSPLRVTFAQKATEVTNTNYSNITPVFTFGTSGVIASINKSVDLTMELTNVDSSKTLAVFNSSGEEERIVTTTSNNSVFVTVPIVNGRTYTVGYVQ